MNIVNLRKGLRRASPSRRVADRRVVPYAFGTPQWIEHVQKNYVAWPKEDRRTNNRRSMERRTPDRRQQFSEQLRMSHRKYSKLLLSREELKLIEDLYLGDIE